MKTIEIYLGFGSLLPILVYHVLLMARIRRKSHRTSYGIIHKARLKWVESIMSEKRDILAIQTMRNWVMASSFLASTSILIGLALLNVAFKPVGFVDFLQTLNLVGSTSEELWMVKLLLLCAMFFTAFFNFTLSIRYYNHAEIMINIPISESIGNTVDMVFQVVNSAARHYTIGMRCFYLTIPLAFWLFGPVWMFISSIILVFVLHLIDRSP